MTRAIAWVVVRHSRAVLVVSLVVFLGLAALAVPAFSLLKSGGFDNPKSDSSRTQAVLNDRFDGSANLLFLVTPTGTGTALDDPSVGQVGLAIVDRLGREPGVRNVASLWTTGDPSLAGSDGRSGLVVAHVDGDDEVSADRAATAIADVQTATEYLSGAVVKAGGSLAVGQDITDQVVVDLAVAEGVAVPITLVLLLLAFGSVVAALLPLAVGFLAVAGAFAVLFVVGSVTDVSIYAINLTTGLGLGLAIDYALLVVNRFREEIGRGAAPDIAVVATLRTAGRTVMFSSAIVATALLAMLSFPLYFLRSFAYAGVGVVVVAMLASVVALPAGLMVLGPRVNAGRLNRSRPVRSASEENAFWKRLVTAVMARPLLTGVPVVLVLLALATPFLKISFSTPDDRVLTDAAQSRQVGDELRARYGGGDDATIPVLVSGQPTTDDLRAFAVRLSMLPGVTTVDGAAGRWRHGSSLAALPGVSTSLFVRTELNELVVTGPADGASAAAQALVGVIRSTPAPGGTSVLVGGSPAVLVDAKAAIGDGLPFALGWIAASTFVLLFLFTGGLLIPVKALVLNVLSLSAVFGIIVWIFQDGHLSGVLGFTPGPIDTSMPVLLFCIAFGLSMDYEVFLLSRVKEEYDAHGDNVAAVVAGVARTGRIVSTSAGLLAVTFFAFGLSQVSFLKLFGIGTALAVVLDATLVRGVLVPSLMRLAGRANWWAPPPLRRLHARVGLSEGPAPTSTTGAGSADPALVGSGRRPASAGPSRRT